MQEDEEAADAARDEGGLAVQGFGCCVCVIIRHKPKVVLWRGRVKDKNCKWFIRFG